jgi:hypothetical protein
VDGSLERKYEGTGLGLPLSKKLVELHGGRLELESEVGVGTKVTVAFPADRLIERSAAAEDANNVGARPHVSVPLTKTFTARKAIAP